MYIPIYSITGESGLVYCGYIKQGNITDMVAVKTAKGSYT